MTSQDPLNGRYRADFPAGTVVFLIGMRVNQIWNVPKWGPVAAAMGPMLSELSRDPDLGLLGFQTWLGWRSVMVQQYWESIDQLMSYATSRDASHLPAWKRFNTRIGAGNGPGNPAVGVWHEAYIVDPATSHVVYVNMPPFGIGKATTLGDVNKMGAQPVRRRGVASEAG